MMKSNFMHTVNVKVILWKMQSLLRMEKGDRGAVDKGNPGMKEKWRKKAIAFFDR